MVPAGINPAIIPTTMRGIDQFLSSAIAIIVITNDYISSNHTIEGSINTAH